jgi:hypothetical protein
MKYLPDRAQLFLAAFWLWTWLLFQFNKLCGVILKCILIWVPDNYVPVIARSAVPVKILKACDAGGNTITNKLQLFLNMKWDLDLFDGKGGIDIEQFVKCVGSSIIWVAYILEYELGPSYDAYMRLMQEGNFAPNAVSKLLRAITIDAKNKLLYKLGNIDHMLFDEVNFHESES